RGMGRPCIAGASDIRMDYKNNQMTVGQTTLSEGDVITLDGTTGRVLVGETTLVPPQLTEEFTQLMNWADEIRNMRVRANADTPTDAKKAREMGAEGIGLCRTEHMFFETDRIVAVREMI